MQRPAERQSQVLAYQSDHKELSPECAEANMQQKSQTLTTFNSVALYLFAVIPSYPASHFTVRQSPET